MTTSGRPLAIVSRRVVLGGDPAPLRVGPARVVCEGPVIRAVEEDPSRPSRFADAELLDFGDAIVAPAFIDAHTHLAMVAFRGLVPRGALGGNVVEQLFFRLESALEDADIRAFTRIGALEAMLHGVGLVWDHYYGGLAVAEGLRDVGLAGVVAPTLQDLAGPGASATEAAFAATLALDDARWQAHGIHVALGPHATDTVSASLWQRTAELARTRGLPVHTHVAQSYEEFARAQARHGCSPVAWLARLGVLDEIPRGLFVHMLFASAEDLRALDPGRHALALCPFSQMQFGFPSPVAEWQAAGLPWVLGSDSAASNDAVAARRELPIVAGSAALAVAHGEARQRFFARGAPEDAQAIDADRRRLHGERARLGQAETLLGAVWSRPGALHPSVRTGIVAEGAWANLVVVDADHPAVWPALDPVRVLAWNDVTPALERLFVRGRMFDPRRLADGDDVRELRAEARTRLDHCLARAGVAVPW